MRQSRFVWFGVLELVLASGFAPVVGPVALTHSPVLLLLTLGGVLALLAGSVAAIEVGGARVTWRHLAGASYLAFAVTTPVVVAPDVLAGSPGSADLLAFGAGVVTACCHGYMGVDVARDGRHFQVTGDVDRVLSL